MQCYQRKNSDTASIFSSYKSIYVSLLGISLLSSALFFATLLVSAAGASNIHFIIHYGPYAILFTRQRIITQNWWGNSQLRRGHVADCNVGTVACHSRRRLVSPRRCLEKQGQLVEKGKRQDLEDNPANSGGLSVGEWRANETWAEMTDGFRLLGPPIRHDKWVAAGTVAWRNKSSVTIHPFFCHFPVMERTFRGCYSRTLWKAGGAAFTWLGLLGKLRSPLLMRSFHGISSPQTGSCLSRV